MEAEYYALKVLIFSFFFVLVQFCEWSSLGISALVLAHIWSEFFGLGFLVWKE